VNPSHLSTIQPPADRANEIINKLLSHHEDWNDNSWQELYVTNEESVVAIGSCIFFTYFAKATREPYKGWAYGHISRIKAVLDSTRSEHTQAVYSRSRT
jgi:F-type H+-transporting ATPase subunit b